MTLVQLLRGRWARHGLGILVVGGVVGLIGPYGTFFDMPILLRWPYWTAVAALSWLQWLLIEGLLDRWTRWPQGAIGSLVAFTFSAPMAAEVMWINPLLGLGRPNSFAELYLSISGTGLLLFWLVNLVLSSLRRSGALEVKASPAEVPFLRRIPARVAGDLLCLRTEDHYLRVFTTEGDDLILMRLKDAVAELDAFDGLQVHRSYWVARAAVVRAERHGRRWHLILKNGVEVPISETHLSAVRNAGWLS